MDTGPVDAHYREGNRNLISAAPELLEAAKLAFRNYPKPDSPSSLRVAMMLEQAIAKAEGATHA
jgi:hypothetical protein